MAESVTFEATIVQDGKTATGIPVPDGTLEALGGKRVPVIVSIGEHTYRSTVSPYKGRVMVPLSAENRSAAGVAAGQAVTVTLTRDDAPRVVEAPAELRTALDADEAASTFYASLPPSHQQAYVTWITDAKKQETRDSRVVSAVEMLREGKRR